jgi:hypothetical protein
MACATTGGRRKDDLAPLAANPQQAVAAFLTQVVNVRAARLEAPGLVGTGEVTWSMETHADAGTVVHDRDIHGELLRAAARLRAAAEAVRCSSSKPVIVAAPQLVAMADRIDPNSYALAQPGSGAAPEALRAAMDDLRAVQAEFQLTSTAPMLKEMEAILATLRRGDG